MTPKSSLLFPPAGLASCISMAIVRDTREVALSDGDRLNYFPATPLVALSVVMQGQLRVSMQLCELEQLRKKDPMAQISAALPQSQPSLSWSAGPVHAITMGVFPEAWAAMGGDITDGHVPPELARLAEIFLNMTDTGAAWGAFCAALDPIWAHHRAMAKGPAWAGSHRIADWTRHLVTQAALSGAGQSARSFERRMKRWTGQSRQSLSTFAQLEDLHRLRVSDPDAGLAEIATDARFSDQSHMGRAVKKMTGFSPAQLNDLIENSEPFWCYRLLGERL